MQSGARALADRVEPGDGRAPVEVRRDAAHGVVSRRSDRNQVATRIDPHLLERRFDVWEAADVPGSHVEVHGAFATALELGLDREGDLVARGELVDEALTARVEQRRPLAP